MFQCLFIKRFKCRFFPLAPSVLLASYKHWWSKTGLRSIEISDWLLVTYSVFSLLAIQYADI